jgi:hypothetical protein
MVTFIIVTQYFDIYHFGSSNPPTFEPCLSPNMFKLTIKPVHNLNQTYLNKIVQSKLSKLVILLN